MSSGFSFRYKVRLSWGSRLPFDEPEWSFPKSSHGLRLVAVTEGRTLRESEWIVLRGDNYETEDAAAAAGVEVRQVVQRAFALLRLGADFGDHYRGGLRLADSFKKELEEKVGGPVLTDHPGLTTFPSQPRPHFFGFSARARADPPYSEVERALTHPGARTPLSEMDNLAHQLFGASFFVDESPEARLLLLMASVESLLEFRPRSDGTQRLIRKWRDEAMASEIDVTERDSIIGQLGFMTQESIGQAAQRMVTAALAGRSYDDRAPAEFLRRVYDLRSRIAHPSAKPPDRQEVIIAIPQLQAMVGDLLAGLSMLDA